MRDGRAQNICWTDLIWEDRIELTRKHNNADWLLDMINKMNNLAYLLSDLSQNNKELLQLYVHYPELWQELREMDRRSYNKFKGKGVDFYERKIIQKLRHKQINLF